MSIYSLIAKKKSSKLQSSINSTQEQKPLKIPKVE